MDDQVCVLGSLETNYYFPKAMSTKFLVYHPFQIIGGGGGGGGGGGVYFVFF